MAQKPMYYGSPYSPQTSLASAIGAADTSITLADASILPEPPNYITIGSYGDNNCETVLYQVRNGNTLSGLTRGVEGSPSTHNAGDPVASYITAALINNIIDNVDGAFSEIGLLGSQKEPKFTDASSKTAAFTKASDTYRFPFTAPPPMSSSPKSAISRRKPLRDQNAVVSKAGSSLAGPFSP